MKLGWDKILIIVMLAFMAMIVGFGIKMATSDVHLYDEDYYEQGEKHKDRMLAEEIGKDVSMIYSRSQGVLNIQLGEEGSIESLRCVNLSDDAKRSAYSW